MKRDLDKARSFERSRGKGLGRGKGMERGPAPKRKKAMPRENRKRRKAQLEVTFGPQADECRHLPCCACFPELYGKAMLCWEYRSPRRISDPHHTKRGPERLDRWTVPLCMGLAGHHQKCSGINSSEKQVQRECGLVLVDVAARIHKDMRGNR